MLSKLFQSSWLRKKTPDDRSVPKPQEATAKSLRPAIQKTEKITLDSLTQGQALESIDNLDVLQHFLKQSDKLDKRTNRALRERVNVLRKEKKQQQALSEQNEKICARLETMARIQHNPLFDGELLHLQQQLQKAGVIDASLQTRFEIAIHKCQNIQRHAEAEKSKLADYAIAEAEQTRQQQQAHEAHMQLVVDQEISDVEAKQEQQKNQQQAQHKKAQQTLKHTETLEKLQQYVPALEKAISAADLKQARDLLHKSQTAVQSLDKQNASLFDGKLHLFAGQLRELQDWQNYAALPKLEALCDAMEKIVTIALPPLQKSEAIRELQDQWRAIKVPSSREADDLWARFKKAADIAWEPCAEFFEQEKKLRLFNLEQRQNICSALEEFFTQKLSQAYGESNVDWKAVTRILEKAKQEFHHFHPVARADEKMIRARFESAMAAVAGKLLIEQQRNEDKKQQLVNAAKSLVDTGKFEQAEERVRQLKEQWKAIGSMRHHVDQVMWSAFQEQCSALFSQRRHAQQQVTLQQQESLQKAQKLCNDIHILAKLPDAELVGSRAQFDILHAQFSAISGIAEKSHAGLKKQFFAACDAWREQLAGIGKRQRAMQWQALARLAALCADLEQNPGLDRESMSAQWEAVSLPSEWRAALLPRWERALAGQAPDYEKNEQRRREVCTKLEILLGFETPQDDLPLRRNVQLQWLTRGFGLTDEDRREQQDALVLLWYSCGSVSAETQENLQARFDRMSFNQV